MSFDQFRISKKPVTSNRSIFFDKNKLFIRKYKKKLREQYNQKSDQELWQDHYSLLKIIEILKFKINRFYQRKIVEISIQKSESVGSIKKSLDQEAVINEQIMNNVKFVNNQKLILHKLCNRLSIISQPIYKEQIFQQINQVTQQITCLKKQLKILKMQVRKRGKQILHEQNEPDKSLLMLRQCIEKNQYKIKQKLIKNESVNISLNKYRQQSFKQNDFTKVQQESVLTSNKLMKYQQNLKKVKRLKQIIEKREQTNKWVYQIKIKQSNELKQKIIVIDHKVELCLQKIQSDKYMLINLQNLYRI